VDDRLREIESAASRESLDRRIQDMPERRTMTHRQPQSFGIDRLTTPIGTALLVVDDEGVLRALDWEDYEPRMKDLLRRQYGDVTLRPEPAPLALATALTAYFKGDLDRLSEIVWRVAGTPFQQKVWSALTEIPAGQTMSYGALAAR
jgi:methylated-DNA-[protein]-cysteine S-methyltransferase